MELDKQSLYLKGREGEKSHKIQGQLVEFQFLKSGRTNNQTLFEHLQDKKVVKMSNSDGGFIKNKSCQNNFFFPHDGIIGLLDTGKAVTSSLCFPLERCPMLSLMTF